MDEKYMQKLIKEQKRTQRVEFINLVACIVLASAILVSAGCDQLEYWRQHHQAQPQVQEDVVLELAPEYWRQHHQAQPQVQEDVVLELAPEDAPKSLVELRQIYRKLLKINEEKAQKNLDLGS